MATPIPGGENFINYSFPMSLSLQFEKEITSFPSSKSQQKVSSTDEMKALVSLESSFQQAIGIDNTSAHSYSTNVNELNIYSSTNTTSAYYTPAILERTLAYPSDDGGYHHTTAINDDGGGRPQTTAIFDDGGYYHTTAINDDGGGGPQTTAITDDGGYHHTTAINDDGGGGPQTTAIFDDGGYHTTAINDDGGGRPQTTAIFDDGGYHHTTAINDNGCGCPPPLPPPDKCDPYNWIPTINRYGNATDQNIRNLMGMLWQTQCYQLPNTRYPIDV